MQLVNDRDKKPLPPYVSYRTFLNFIEALHLGIPARIDRSYWGERYSGSNGTQLMTALRFLGLIDTNGVPMMRLRQLVSAKGAQRSQVLSQIANTAFDFLLERSIDPKVATYAQLEEAFFDAYQITSDVARKCIKFFVSLQGDAGVTLSPFIMKRSKTRRAISSKTGMAKTGTGTNRNSAKLLKTDQVPPQLTWHEMVLAKFPALDPDWPDEVKMKWFEAFDTLLKRSFTSGME